MGSADQGASAGELFRQRAARRDVDRLARSVRRVFRHEWRTGIRLAERRRQLGCAGARSAARALGRGADAAMTAPMVRIVLPTPLRQLARVNGELRLGGAERVTQRTILDAVEAS